MNVAWYLETFPDMRLEDATPKLGCDGIPVDKFGPDQCSKVQRFPVRRLDSCTTYRSDTIGFFIAKFRKIKR
jgi:16S rRNA C967 or C1407 C5-methylase (RsmB/RsmF family)